MNETSYVFTICIKYQKGEQKSLSLDKLFETRNHLICSEVIKNQKISFLNEIES